MWGEDDVLEDTRGLVSLALLFLGALLHPDLEHHVLDAPGAVGECEALVHSESFTQ